MIYEVTIDRTERITFRLDATDPDDAEARYLMDGDETDADTISTEVIEVREAE